MSMSNIFILLMNCQTLLMFTDVCFRVASFPPLPFPLNWFTPHKSNVHFVNVPKTQFTTPVKEVKPVNVCLPSVKFLMCYVINYFANPKDDCALCRSYIEHTDGYRHACVSIIMLVLLKQRLLVVKWMYLTRKTIGIQLFRPGLHESSASYTVGCNMHLPWTCISNLSHIIPHL